MSLLFWSGLTLIGGLDPLVSRAPMSGLFHFATVLGISMLFFAWFMADARDLGLAPSRALQVGVLSVAVVAIPYYLLRYKGLRRSAVSILKFAAFLSVSLISQLALAHWVPGAA